MLENSKYNRHVYTIERERKQYNCYQLEKAENPLLTSLLRIEKDRQYNNSKGLEYWLRLRNTNNWSNCKLLTGLYKTKYKNIYFGDARTKQGKQLIIFIFSKDKTKLTIDYYTTVNYAYLKDNINRLIEMYQN